MARTFASCQWVRVNLVDATLEFTGTGVDFDLVTDLHEGGHRPARRRCPSAGRLGHFTGGVATGSRLGVFDFTNDGGRQFYGDGFLVVESHFAEVFHAVYQVVQHITQVVFPTSGLYSVSIKTYSGSEVGVGALFTLQLNDVQLVVGLEDGLLVALVQQTLQASS